MENETYKRLLAALRQEYPALIVFYCIRLTSDVSIALDRKQLVMRSVAIKPSLLVNENKVHIFGKYLSIMQIYITDISTVN